MSRILFIAPADLGETVLALGALDYVVRPNDSAVIACSREAEPLFRGLPGLAKIITIDDAKPIASWWAVYSHGAPGGDEDPLDFAIDARGMSSILPVGNLVRRKPGKVLRHIVEEWTELVGAPQPAGPRLWIDDAARSAAAAIAPDAVPLLVLAPGGVKRNKRWPPERFAAVARRLADGALGGARIVVVGAAARDADITRAIVLSLEADGVAAADLGTGLDLLAAAALMERATLVIGNDNALTHIAAAAGAATLTLFGPTDERVRAPYGPRARTLRGRSFEEIAALPELDGAAAMNDVSIDAVETAALELLHAGGLR